MPLSNFLKDISFNIIGLGESVNDFKKNKHVKADLTPFSRDKDSVVYKFRNVKVELPGVTAFKIGLLCFENDVLSVILFESFERDYGQLFYKLSKDYGEPISYHDNPLGIYYIWDDGQYVLELKTNETFYLVTFKKKKVKISKQGNKHQLP